MEGTYNLPLVSHPPPQPTLLPPTHPLIRSICDITVAVNEVAEIQQ